MLPRHLHPCLLILAHLKVILTRNIEDILLEDSHHPNSVYSHFSRHSEDNLKIFYQNGVSQNFTNSFELSFEPFG